MNIFKHEFKMKKTSILIWSISLSAFLIFYMAFFPALSKNALSFDSIMDSFPKEMLQVLGVRRGLSLTSLVGYFTMTFTMAQLGLAVQAANYGFSILTEEERDQTADFLLTKPVSREQIYFNKVISAVLSLIITSVVLGISCFLVLELFDGGDSYEFQHVLKLVLTIPLFQMVFFSLAMFISLLFDKVKSVLSLSMGLALGLYVVDGVREIINSDILGYISPYYYFEAGYILIEGGYDLNLLYLALGIITLSFLSSYLLYIKRDIN